MKTEPLFTTALNISCSQRPPQPAVKTRASDSELPSNTLTANEKLYFQMQELPTRS